MESGIAMGWLQMMLLIGMGGGGMAGDLVSFVPADVYFKSRDVPIIIENMADFASREPKDGEWQIKQLLALRTLAERPELVKNAKNRDEIIGMLEKIARGALAKDKHGFSQEYAVLALAALGKQVELPGAAMAGNAREQALSWFPASATLVGVVVPKPRLAAPSETGKEMRDLFSKFLPARAWEQIFKTIEQIGNVRVERAAFAFQQEGTGQRFFVRLSGKADHGRLVNAIKTLAARDGLKVEEKTDDQKTPMTLFHDPRETVTMACIGDTEFVFAGYGRARDKDQPNLFEQMLRVRAGKEANVLQSQKIRAGLAKASDKAFGLVVGDVPEDLRKQMGRGSVPAPRAVRAEAAAIKDGFDLRLYATMDSAEDARGLAQKIQEGQKLGLSQLVKLPAEMPVSAATVAGLRRALQSVQAKADGTSVEASVSMPHAGFLAMPMWFLFSHGDALPPAEAIPMKQ